MVLFSQDILKMFLKIIWRYFGKHSFKLFIHFLSKGSTIRWFYEMDEEHRHLNITSKNYIENSSHLWEHFCSLTVMSVLCNPFSSWLLQVSGHYCFVRLLKFKLLGPFITWLEPRDAEYTSSVLKQSCILEYHGYIWQLMSISSHSVCWDLSLSSSVGLRTSALSPHLLKHKALLLDEQSCYFSVYLVELLVIFQIQNAYKTKQCCFLPASFLKSHGGESMYCVFCMNRKPSVMTGIPESIAVSAAVEKVHVSGTNSITFWGKPHTFWLGYWSMGGKAIRCLKKIEDILVVNISNETKIEKYYYCFFKSSSIKLLCCKTTWKYMDFSVTKFCISTWRILNSQNNLNNSWTEVLM